jgi:hypothetical protein
MPLLFFVLALLHGLIYAAVIPPWQSPDEHGHFEYAWLVAQYGPAVGPESISLEFQKRVLESMARFDFWRLVHQPKPQALPTSFIDPSTLLLEQSRPQVGDERPLYYVLVGGVLALVGDHGVVTGMYVGRVVSVLLYATAVGVAALTTRRLFPQSLFLQTVPPAFALFLPMLGQMSAAVNSDAMGVLTSTLFFATLVPIFQRGLTWQRGGAVVVMLLLALLSKKTTLFLVPTALLALPTYAWTRGMSLSRRAKLALAVGAAQVIVLATALALMPAGDATGWWEQTGECGHTRFEGEAIEGKAVLRIGLCDEVLAQALPLEAARMLSGQHLKLEGWVRGESGPATGQVSVRDNVGYSELQVAATEEWQPFVVAHTVNASARWVAVRLAGEGSSGGILFDGLTLSTEEGENHLVNGSAEQEEHLLLDLLSNASHRFGAPRRFVERVLTPQSWKLEAWRAYWTAALFCSRSFWGSFGWLAVPLPSLWYRVLGVCWLLALAGNIIFIVSKPRRGWQTGCLFLLMGSLVLVVLQVLLPMVGMRETRWLPQGRYLFPGIFAVGVSMAWGFYQVLPRGCRVWAAAAFAGLMVSYDLCCLGALIVPYFWGPV